MPTYDYRCDHCGHAFSAVQSFSDVALEECPSCGKKPRRLISMPAIVFKGSGWYKTDSRAPAPSADGASAKAATKGGKGDEKDKPGTSVTPAMGEKSGTAGAGNSAKKSEGGAKTDAASSTTADKGAGAGPAGSGGSTSSGGGSGGSGG